MLTCFWTICYLFLERKWILQHVGLGVTPNPFIQRIVLILKNAWESHPLRLNHIWPLSLSPTGILLQMGHCHGDQQVHYMYIWWYQTLSSADYEYALLKVQYTSRKKKLFRHTTDGNQQNYISLTPFFMNDNPVLWQLTHIVSSFPFLLQDNYENPLCSFICDVAKNHSSQFIYWFWLVTRVWWISLLKVWNNQSLS